MYMYYANTFPRTAPILVILIFVIVRYCQDLYKRKFYKFKYLRENNKAE